METCNFATIKRFANEKIDGNTSDPILVPQLQFRTSKLHDVTTRHIEKNFRVTSDKRRVIGNDTLPYGWVDNQSDENAFVDLMMDAIETDD